MRADDVKTEPQDAAAPEGEERAVSAGEASDGCETAPSLETLLEEARSEAEQYKDEAARAKADFYNYRTRVERERARDRVLAAEGAVTDLLPVLDNLVRALDAEPDKESPMYKGVSMVQKQFFAALQNLGLRAITAEGAFDPALHEAVMTVDVELDDEDGAIVEQLSQGYMLGDRVLRAARVKVGRKKTEEDGVQ
ncbi:MAG: nucleotide exchange factor GrpE [Synergistaceae bacterium]|jgi:molecular chaperone GrpE|nr:nucleotide exchange factor GrpE [Synergistaceae bacterium]